MLQVCTGLNANSLGEAPDTPHPQRLMTTQAHRSHLMTTQSQSQRSNTLINYHQHFISAAPETNQRRLALSPSIKLLSFRGSAAAVSCMLL